MIVWGGGHTDYHGNEVYGLNLNANPIAWRLERDATHNPNLAGGACPESNADGTPTSRHTGEALEYLPNQDWYEMFGYGCYNGGFSDQMWKLNPSFSWTQLAIPSSHPDPANNGSEPVFAYDSVSDKIYWLEGNTGTFWSYSGSANTWTSQLQTGLEGCFFQDSSAVVDPVRRLYICTGGAVRTRLV